MQHLLVFILAAVATAAQPSEHDIRIPATEIAHVEVSASIVAITFAPDSQCEALAENREFTITVGFPFPAAKSLSVSEVRWVAHQFAGISLRLPSHEEAEQFAQAVRDGRVQLLTHRKA